jgi:hypothetical protein
LILQEATIGGTVYLADLDYADEKNLPEDQRAGFEYRALSNRERVALIYRCKSGLTPNWADICEAAVTRILNIKRQDGTPITSIQDLMAYHDKDKTIMVMLIAVGNEIWKRQSGDSEALKNSK